MFDVADPREAEIEDLHHPIVGQHDIGGLEIPVHDAGRVGVSQRVSQLAGDGEDLPAWHRAAARKAGHRLALGVLHHDARMLSGLNDVVDGCDIRMRDLGGGARLAKEAASGLWRVERGIRKCLEGDLAIQARINSQVDGAHPAGSQPFDDAIRADRRVFHVASRAARNGRAASSCRE